MKNIEISVLSSFKDQLTKTEISEDEESTSTNYNEKEHWNSTECLSVDEINFEKHETLHVYKNFDFVWPGAIERLKIADTRKKSNYQIKI